MISGVVVRPQHVCLAFMGPALTFVLLTVAGHANREQQDVVDYLKAENDTLRSKLSGRRIRFTDEERRRLAQKGERLGRSLLRSVSQLVTPETILRWYRRLIAVKYDGSKNRKAPGAKRDNDRTTETIDESQAPAKSNWASFLRDHADVLVCG